MLVDHRRQVEQLAYRRREREKLPKAFGEFLSQLAPWDWFVNPLTFRDSEIGSGPPVPEAAIARIEEYLALVQRQAPKPIGWVIAEEFGRLGGRWHCHMLVSGVGNIHRKFWWQEAFRRFGYTKIEPFDRDRGAAFYAAKYVSKALGALHFGGTLAGMDLSRLTEEPAAGGKRTVIRSAEVPKSFFRLGMGRWHR